MSGLRVVSRPNMRSIAANAFAARAPNRHKFVILRSNQLQVRQF